VTTANPTADANTLITNAVPGASAAEASLLDAAGVFVNAGTILAAGPAGRTFTIASYGTTIGGTAQTGIFINTGTMEVDAGNSMTLSVGSGAEMTNEGDIVANGGMLAVSGSVANTGSIADSGGTVSITGALTGAGSISLSAGAVLTLGAATRSGTVVFADASDTLVLSDDTEFHDTFPEFR
jgi:hypothetical protein